MNPSLHRRLFDTAAPLLAPGEQPVAGGRCRMQEISLATNLAGAVAMAAVSGNPYMWAGMNNKQYFTLLTDRRLLILEAHWITFRPTTKVVGELDRASLVVTDVKEGLMTSFTVGAAGESRGLRLKFPRSERKDAHALLEKLGSPVA